MRIMVTGSQGFIGSKLCRALESLGHEILSVNRKLTIAESNYEKVDLIYHLAAQIDLQYSRKYPRFDAYENIIETIRLIEKYPSVKVIYPATAASIPITSPYGLSKQTAAEYIQLLCKEYVICTLPNIWGPGGHGAIDKFMQADVIKINGTGEQTRTILHADDVVKAFIKAMDWPKGVYMLGGQVVSVKEMAEKVATKTGKKVEYNLDYDPVKEGEIYASVIPNTTPNWQPEIEL